MVLTGSPVSDIMSAMPNEDLIGAEEAGSILKLHSRTVKRRAADGTLPYVTKLAGDKGAYVFDRNVIAAERARLDRVEALEAELAAVKTEKVSA